MNNINALRKAKGLTLKELGRLCDISESSMQRIERGTRRPSFEVLLKLTDALECSSEEIFGSREVAEIAKLPPAESEIERKYAALDEHGKAAVDAILDLEYRRCVKTEVIDFGTIRKYLSRPAAGLGGLVEGEDYEDIPRTAETPREADFALVVSGDSMEPYIHDGETIYIDEKAELRDLDVGVFCVDGATYVKQYAPGIHEYYLLSANTKRGYITIRESGNQSVQYFGKVILPKKLPRPVYEA